MVRWSARLCSVYISLGCELPYACLSFTMLNKVSRPTRVRWRFESRELVRGRQLVLSQSQAWSTPSARRRCGAVVVDREGDYGGQTIGHIEYGLSISKWQVQRDDGAAGSRVTRAWRL